LVPLYGAVLSTVVRFAERKRSSTLKDFIVELDHAREHNYSIASSYMPPDGVQLMTAHGAKGLEFEYVFIVHATDNIWGGGVRIGLSNYPSNRYLRTAVMVVQKTNADSSMWR